MTWFQIGLSVFMSTAVLALPATGQMGNSTVNDPREFIQSSSPLGDGSQISSRSVAGGEARTYVSQANFQSQQPMTGYQPRETWNLQGGDSRQALQAAPRYAYPTVAQAPTNTLGLEPVQQQWGQPAGNMFQQTYSTSAQNCPTCVGSGIYPTQAQFSSPQFPNQIAPQPIYPPGVQTPQPWLNPNSNPAGNRTNYTPLISLRNLPPGTYLGQGIIGQPKAYVDGEPVRNLFRYILP